MISWKKNFVLWKIQKNSFALKQNENPKGKFYLYFYFLFWIYLFDNKNNTKKTKLIVNLLR